MIQQLLGDFVAKCVEPAYVLELARIYSKSGQAEKAAEQYLSLYNLPGQTREIRKEAVLFLGNAFLSEVLDDNLIKEPRICTDILF